MLIAFQKSDFAQISLFQGFHGDLLLIHTDEMARGIIVQRVIPSRLIIAKRDCPL